MWKSIAPWSFLNTDLEIHSFWIGVLQAFPLPLLVFLPYRIIPETEYDPRKELHYYALGRSVGVLLSIGFWIGLSFGLK